MKSKCAFSGQSVWSFCTTLFLSVWRVVLSVVVFRLCGNFYIRQTCDACSVCVAKTAFGRPNIRTNEPVQNVSN